MELWIRNQDKKRLIKIDNIKVYEDPKDNYSDIRAVFNDYELSLGEYKTKERALEVLDEIQKRIISKKGIITSSNDKTEFIPFENQAIIYEIPKE